MTVNASSSTRSRPGTVVGTAAAAASETTPRMPDQATTVMLRHDGFGLCRSGRYVAGNTHASRTSIVASSTATIGHTRLAAG